MASADRRQRPTVTLDTGDLVDDVTRKAQERADAESIRVNLSEKGSWYHGIGGGDELSLLIFEEGIWISTTDE
jgi:hypothetical protein